MKKKGILKVYSGESFEKPTNVVDTNNLLVEESLDIPDLNNVTTSE